MNPFKMIRSTLAATLILLLAGTVAGCYMDCNCELGEPSLGNREKWKAYLQVEDAPEGAPIATTQTQISNVSPDLAVAKINQALETYEDELGYRLTTVFQIGEQSEEIAAGGAPAITDVVVNGHYYYIAPLDYPGGDKGAAIQTNYQIPAIAVVDAEDETKPAWIRTKDANEEPYKIVLRFENQEVLDDKVIGRWLRSNGYRTYAENEYRLDDPTLEVDDDWRPYFTATYVKNDGYLNRGDAWYPQLLLVTDAQTREIQEFQLDNPNTLDTDESQDNDEPIPSWVDRIYSEQLVLDWISYWGYNPGNYGRASDLDEFVVDGGQLDVVMNAANTNLVFVAYITSKGADNSVVGTMLIDPRTGKTTMYWNTSEATGMATKSAATNTILQAVNEHPDFIYDVEDLTLHTIYGVRTWEGVITRPAYKNFGDSLGSTHRYGSLYAGTVLLEANFDLKPANVIWADSKHEAFTRYEEHLYLRQNTRVGSNVLEDKEVRGVVEGPPDRVTLGGDTSYLIRLVGHPGEVWEVPLTYIGDPNNEDVLGVAAGNQVYLRYGDPHNRDTYLVRQIDLVSTE